MSEGMGLRELVEAAGVGAELATEFIVNDLINSYRLYWGLPDEWEGPDENKRRGFAERLRRAAEGGTFRAELESVRYSVVRSAWFEAKRRSPDAAEPQPDITRLGSLCWNDGDEERLEITIEWLARQASKEAEEEWDYFYGVRRYTIEDLELLEERVQCRLEHYDDEDSTHVSLADAYLAATADDPDAIEDDDTDSAVL